MDPVVSVAALTKTYRDGTHALRDVTFDVAPGEIFGLLGPNGAGKTTAMRILGMLHRKTSGKAEVLGLDTERHAGELRRRIGFAMQEVGMDELATAREMLRFHARLYGLSAGDARLRADELLATFRLETHADRRVTRFSGGMQRRLDLAVSLVHRPEVLFLDEPSTGLDPTSRSELWGVLRALRNEQGITILMSTHYMDEADALCDRVAVMDQGAISAIDTPEALKRSVGADRIRVRFARPLAPAQAEDVARRFGSRGRVHDDVLEVAVDDGGASLLPVIQEVATLGLEVASTRVLSPTLDDVFLKYTGTHLGTTGEARPAGHEERRAAGPGAAQAEERP